jgi:hypothetical protein
MDQPFVSGSLMVVIYLLLLLYTDFSSRVINNICKMCQDITKLFSQRTCLFLC